VADMRRVEDAIVYHHPIDFVLAEKRYFAFVSLRVDSRLAAIVLMNSVVVLGESRHFGSAGIGSGILENR
jgi:hypothetical protein